MDDKKTISKDKRRHMYSLNTWCKLGASISETIQSVENVILITLLITLERRHAGMPFLSVLESRADGSNPTAPVNTENPLGRVDFFVFIKWLLG